MLISQDILYWTQATIKNFGALPIIMTYGSPVEMGIDYVVILSTSSGMEQDIHTNTSKYGMW